MGDSHVPNRASEIPEKFQKMLVPNKMQHVLCTGNLVTKEQYDELRNLAPNVHVVAGDCDQEGVYSDTKIITIGQFRIGLCHGHQIVPWGDQYSLAALQRKMNVDILITGHTHMSHIRTEQGKWFINPGSITGAFSSCSSDVVPSFMLMALQGPKVFAFLYELKDNNVVVSKTIYLVFDGPVHCKSPGIISVSLICYYFIVLKIIGKQSRQIELGFKVLKEHSWI